MHSQIDDKTVINQAILDNPATISVFAKYGIDSCCGGAHTISEATRAHGINTEKVIEELRQVTEEEA